MAVIIDRQRSQYNEVDDVSTTIAPSLSLLPENDFIDNDSDIDLKSYTDNIDAINYNLEFFNLIA